MHSFTSGVLEKGIIRVDAIEALLVVIPKEPNPVSMRGFRPLSLCNVPIKVVSKMVVNGLKLLMKVSLLQIKRHLSQDDTSLTT